jgi:hypothetical protein
MTDYSLLRKELHDLMLEYADVCGYLLRPVKKVRGSLRWRTCSKREGANKYPSLHRSVNGNAVGRNVKIGDVEWLEPLLENYRTYKKAQQRLDTIHARIHKIVRILCADDLYDYEPQACETGCLIRDDKEEK